MLRELTKGWAALSDESWIAEGADKAAQGAMAADGAVPFATGNWGSGVFGGDPALKAMIQWIAASRAGRETFYYSFGDARVKGLGAAVEALLKEGATVGELACMLLKFGKELRSKGVLSGVLPLLQDVRNA